MSSSMQMDLREGMIAVFVRVRSAADKYDHYTINFFRTSPMVVGLGLKRTSVSHQQPQKASVIAAI